MMDNNGMSGINGLRAASTLLAFCAVAFLPALTGAVFPPDDWYVSLTKPYWNPPARIFGPVWTVLYLLVGIAGYVAWRASAAGARFPAFFVYAIQLALNASWTPIFFGLHAPGPALAILTVLLAVVMVNVVVFCRLKRIAGYLLLPYLAWIGFASLLNAAIVTLN